MAAVHSSASDRAHRTEIWRFLAGQREQRLLPLFGIAVLGVVFGSVIATTELNALYLCAAVIGCAFILYDFRIGVVLLILLMPVSGSVVFPHEMFGVTGINPLNLLLLATLGSYLLRGLFDGSLKHFVPQPLLWLYVVPILVAGALGSRHVDDIAPVFYMRKMLEFNNTAGYLRDLVLKPLLLVLFALLMGAAVARSARPERFLAPTLISIWAMGLLVLVFVYLFGTGLGEMASSTSREFLSALGMHANELGRLYAIAYALLLFTWAESKQFGLRLVLLVSMGLVVAALVLTFSRGAFVGLIVVNLLFLVWHRNARALIFLGLVAALVPFVLPDAVYDRVTTGFAGGLNAVSAGRIDGLWLPLLPEVGRNPIFGSGLGSILWSDVVRTAGGATVLETTHPHNAYLQALLDMGIVGLILVCTFFALVWRDFRVMSRDAALSPTLRGFCEGAAAGLLCFLIASFTDGSLTPRPEQSFLWLAIGMMYGLRAKRAVR